MSERLDLSGEQTGQLRSLYDAQAGGTRLTRAAMREQFAAVLTDAQLTRLDQGKVRHSSKQSRRHGGC